MSGEGLKSAHIITYGCQMNVYESAVMERILQEQGYELTDCVEDAQIVILNTCTVREKPARKVFGQLGQLARMKERRPELKVVVSGCMAQLRSEELLKKAPVVDAVFGPRNLSDFRAFLSELGLQDSSSGRPGGRSLQGVSDDGATVATSLSEYPFFETRPAIRRGDCCAYVSIIEGCSNFCAYCIVPYVRGAEVSRPAEELLAEVREQVAGGIRDVTLLGQNVNAYGRDLENGLNFVELLEEICKVEGLWRLRFTTSHPRDFSAEIVEAVARLPQACEHFHLPIQSGDDEILEGMGRGYTVAQYRSLVEEIRRQIPGASISTDVMVGFPGESEENFRHTLRTFEEIGFDQAFMFIYGDRPGTAASGMDGKVERKIAGERLKRLVELQNCISREINREHLGEAVEVLVEGSSKKREEMLTGRTRTNKIVNFAGAAGLRGKLVKVRTRTAHLWGFGGELIGESSDA